MTDWIDVNDRLPENDAKVVAKASFPFLLGVECIFHRFENPKNYEFIALYSGRLHYIILGVTHWKPIKEEHEFHH